MGYAVTFSRYGGPEVLELVEMDRPAPGNGEVVVDVVAAGLNPVDTYIREGRFADTWPASFPVGQGSDFAGFISAIGPGVTEWRVNDPVLGHTVRGAQASYVTVPAENIVRKPPRLTWEVAGSLFVAASIAWKAVRDVNPRQGQTVLVHAAAGGVGCIAAQLCRLTGARVIGTASRTSFDYLRGWGVIPVEYGPGLEDRLRAIAPNGVNAELEHVGDMSLANVDSHDIRALEAVAELVANRQIAVPIAAIYPLERVQDAYRELEAGHAHGKIVLGMTPVEYSRQKVHAVDIRETEVTRDAPGRVPAPLAHEVLPPVFGHLPHHDRHRDGRADTGNAGAGAPPP